MMFKVIEDLDVYAYRLGLNKWASPLMIFIYPTTWPIVIYRFGNWILKKCKIPIIKEILFIIYFIFKRLSEILTGIEIAQNAQIGKGLFIGHLGGVIIGNSSIGDYPSFHEGVTIGGAGRGENHGTPTIGNLVYFGAGAKVIGRINVGNNVIIGANAVVVKDIPDNVSIGGIPAKILNNKGSVDYIHF